LEGYMGDKGLWMKDIEIKDGRMKVDEMIKTV
jgi:hypothetical protein